MDDDVLSTFGQGTVVLSSGGNQVVPDEAGTDEPSAFTGALAEVLVDDSLLGTHGLLTAEDVYAALDRYEPRLVPRPQRNLRAQGRIGLAARPAPAAVVPAGLRGWPEQVRVIPVSVRFSGEQVVSEWDRNGDGEITNDERDVTALDATRLAAIRRLCQLADAVMRAKEYGDPPWQRRARRALETAGANLFEAALPPQLQQLMRDTEDQDDVLVRVDLSFEPPWGRLSEYPWEYLHVPPDGGAETIGAAQRRVVVSRAGRNAERPSRASDDVVDVAVVSSLAPPYARLAQRLGAELVRMPTVRTLTAPDEQASWARLMEAIDTKPEYLVLCTPLLRFSRDAQVSAKLGFVGVRQQTDWHTAEELAGMLRGAGGPRFVVVVSVAAEDGLDAIRAAPIAAGALNRELGVPVAFICHTPGLEGYVDDENLDEPRTFAGLLVAALTTDHDLVRSVWFARDRVLRWIPSDLQPTLGVPGFYCGALPDRPQPPRPAERTPGRLANRSRPGKG